MPTAATLSQDSIWRIELRITHRLGLHELANALCSAFRFHDEDDPDDGPLPEMSRAVTDRHLRTEIAYRGDSEMLGGWSDHLTEKQTEARLEWAERHVLRAFPALAAGQEQEPRR